MRIEHLVFVIILFFAFSCKKTNQVDAYGNFSADEILLSSQTLGKIIKVNVNEGDSIFKNDTLAIIDTSTLYLQKMQLLAQKRAISTKFSTVVSQVNVQNEQKSVLERERNRIANLLKDSAVSQKQFDDINGQINILEQSINATKSNNTSIFAELDALESSIKLINYQISNCYIISPINAVILEKYFNVFEIAQPARPIFKIADISQMKLTAYVSEDQLFGIKLGQKCKVMIDSLDNGYKIFEGKIISISNTAEFTPKEIQTKKERVTFVYAVKILVPNDGSIKIGMPAEVIFQK